MAAVAMLVQELFVVPLAWGLMRFVTGLCFASILVISGRWLNNRAINLTRGRLLAVYMVVIYLGQGGALLLWPLVRRCPATRAPSPSIVMPGGGERLEGPGHVLGQLLDGLPVDIALRKGA